MDLKARASINVPANALIVCDLERLERPDYEMVPDSLPGMDLGGVEKNITESGLVYYDMVEGDGPMPSGPSVVKSALHRIFGER